MNSLRTSVMKASVMSKKITLAFRMELSFTLTLCIRVFYFAAMYTLEGYV